MPDYTKCIEANNIINLFTLDHKATYSIMFMIYQIERMTDRNTRKKMRNKKTQNNSASK